MDDYHVFRSPDLRSIRERYPYGSKIRSLAVCLVAVRAERERRHFRQANKWAAAASEWAREIAQEQQD